MIKLMIGLICLAISFATNGQQWLPSTASSSESINRTGNVGIGTTSPGARLSFKNVDETTEADGITWFNPSPMGYGIFRTPGSWTAPNYQQLKLQFPTGIVLDPGASYGRSYVEIAGGGLRVSGGNVGIGTLVPNSKLDVTKNFDGITWNLQVANEHHDVAGDQAVGIKLKLGDDGESDKWAGILGVSEGTWENFVGLSFYTTGYATGAQNSEKMRISSNGNVGIGTTAPDAKLTVKGNIHAQGVDIDMSGATGPDYVFEKDYDLLSLSEIETYIKQNKHLPEVPSAKEMEANGLNLKEMNLILLKKVEELTLHLIEQEKKIEALQQGNKKCKRSKKAH